MHVYVESNFVLELALGQEQSESCDELIRIATAGSIHLIVPAFSLAEPHLTIMRKGNERSKLAADLSPQLLDLARSKAYRQTAASFGDLTAVLIDSAAHERAELMRSIMVILKTAEIIPLDSGVLQEAKRAQGVFDMSFQDSIVLASVVSHLERTNPKHSCFLNRNTRDFDDPNVIEVLDRLRCKFIGRFDDGLRYVQAYRL